MKNKTTKEIFKEICKLAKNGYTFVYIDGDEIYNPSVSYYIGRVYIDGSRIEDYRSAYKGDKMVKIHE